MRPCRLILEALEIRGPDGGVIKFDLDAFKRHCLLNGLDDIGLTMERAPKIESYYRKDGCCQPSVGIAHAAFHSQAI